MVEEVKQVYRPDIDGLRALAVLSVVFFHAFPELVPGGFIGVDIFFVISGYLITGSLIGDGDHRKFDLINFYTRRILRLTPALLTVLVSVWMLGFAILTQMEFKSLGAHLAWGSLFLTNIALWMEAGYFDAASELKPLLNLWSLGVEEQFYILWPLIVLIVYRTNRSFKTILGLICVISYILNVGFVDSLPAATFFLPFTRFWELGIGGVLIVFLKNTNPSKFLISINKSNTVTGFGLALIIYSAFKFNHNFMYPGHWALVPVIGTILLLISCSSQFSRRLLASNLLVWFGLLSYPIYLWHWPLLSFMRITYQGDVPVIFRICIVAFSIFLAWLTYRYIEQPIRFSAPRKLQKPKLVALTLLIGLAIMAILGLTTFMLNGMTNRSFNIEQNNSAFIWPDSYERDPKCQSKFGFAADGYCMFSGREAPKVIVFGDSHGAVMYHAFLERPDNDGEGVAFFGKGGCPPMLGIERKNVDGVYGCPKLAKEIIDYAVREQAVRKIYIVGNFAIYSSGESFKARENTLKSVKIFDNSENFNNQTEILAGGLDRTIDMLTKAGKEVILIHQIPELGFDPKSCVASRFESIINLPVNHCMVSRNDVSARQLGYRDSFSKILQKYPQVVILDPLDVLCDESDCMGKSEGKVMYRDSEHLNIEGAIKLRFLFKEAKK